MVNNIANKVQSLVRSLESKPPKESPDQKQIRLVSSFGSDTDIVNSVSKFERALSRTRSFSTGELDSQTTAAVPSPTVPQTKPVNLIQHVKKTGPSLRNRLVKTRNLAVGHRYGQTSPCNSRNCKCCEMLTDLLQFSINGLLVNVALGTCASYNIIYLIMCIIPNCKMCYTGRSVRALRVRIGEHRRAFYQIIDGKPVDLENDDFSPGLHLKEHNCIDKGDFNKYFRVCLLEICSPKILAVREHFYIHKYNTLRPNGMNASNPFGIPLLN